MTTSKTCSVSTDSPEDTRALAARIGRLAQAHLVITLTGDLGSGKTCFVQGLAQGLGLAPGIHVTSPTYTLINTYAGRLTLHHVDLYRLSGAEWDDIGLAELMAAPAVTAIEWSERMAHELPEERLAIDIRILDDTTRRFDLTAYGLGPAILLQGLQNDI